jgi:hypothetical protein
MFCSELIRLYEEEGVDYISYNASKYRIIKRSDGNPYKSEKPYKIAKWHEKGHNWSHNSSASYRSKCIILCKKEIPPEDRELFCKKLIESIGEKNISAERYNGSLYNIKILKGERKYLITRA